MQNVRADSSAKIQNVRGDSSAHYRRERNHQGLDNALIEGAALTGAGRVRRQSRLVDCSISTHVQRDQPRIASAERWDRTAIDQGFMRKNRVRGRVRRLTHHGKPRDEQDDLYGAKATRSCKSCWRV